MNGYLIAVIIMLIMFVALMIRLMQEPVEEPLLLKPVPPPSARAHLTAPESASPATASASETNFSERDAPDPMRRPVTQDFEDPLDRLIAFEGSSPDVPKTLVDLAPENSALSETPEDANLVAEPEEQVNLPATEDDREPTPADEPGKAMPPDPGRSE